MAPEHPGPPPLEGSPRLVPWHPRLPPRRGAGQWRPRQTILARPSLTIARRPALRLGRRPGALMRSSPPPPLPPPHAAILVDPTRPSLPSRTYIRPPSTQYRGPGPERVGPQATLPHPPCTNLMASPLWVDGRWMGDLKEPAGGGGAERGERHQCCRLLLSTPLCPLVLRSPSLEFPSPAFLSLSLLTHYLSSPRKLACVSGSWKHRAAPSFLPPLVSPNHPLRETPCPSCATRRPRCAAGPIRTSLGA